MQRISRKTHTLFFIPVNDAIGDNEQRIKFESQKPCYRRGTARRPVSVELLSIDAQVYEQLHYKTCIRRMTFKATQGHSNCRQARYHFLFFFYIF